MFIKFDILSEVDFFINFDDFVKFDNFVNSIRILRIW